LLQILVSCTVYAPNSEDVVHMLSSLLLNCHF